MYVSYDFATDEIAERLGIDQGLCKTLAIFGRRRESDRIVEEAWTRDSVLTGLNDALAMQKDRKSAHATKLTKELWHAIDKIPDDRICEAIGWFIGGYELSMRLNDGVLANNSEEVHANILSALDVDKLSEPVLRILGEDIDSFELYACVPSKLKHAIDAVTEDDESDEAKSE